MEIFACTKITRYFLKPDQAESYTAYVVLNRTNRPFQIDIF